ncbi:uncharacterized protein LOC100901629 [Trichonephila clavipes]|nr:uncharacterized protein LOC100901629 [Trichonephila clavipes]
MHNENCKPNLFGNSGILEGTSAIETFQRSESLHGLQYTKYLGDGDSSAYKAVNEMQPYGDTGFEKRKCVGYVEKRMETQLRALKPKVKQKKEKKPQAMELVCVNYKFNILKDNEGRRKQHSRTLIGLFMARRELRVLTLEQSGLQSAFAVETYFSNGLSMIAVQCSFFHHFDIPPRSHALSERKFVSMRMNAFRATGNISKERKVPQKTVRTPENI